MSQQRVFVATPSYDGRMSVETHYAVMDCQRVLGDVVMTHHRVSTCSLLPRTFNELWVEAWKLRDELDWFAMIHTDIAPQTGWLATMVREAMRVKASLLSAVVRIKDTDGDFSTALDLIQDDESVLARRMHVADICKLPTSFTRREVAKLWKKPLDKCGALLTNTGLWVADMRAPWINKVSFRLRSGIDYTDDDARAWIESEDWELARDLHGMGIETWATQIIQVYHIGMIRYDNWPASQEKSKDNTE